MLDRGLGHRRLRRERGGAGGARPARGTHGSSGPAYLRDLRRARGDGRPDVRGIVHVFVSELKGQGREAMLAPCGPESSAGRTPWRRSSTGRRPEGDRWSTPITSWAASAGRRSWIATWSATHGGLIAQGRSVLRRYGTDGETAGDGLRVHVAAYADAPRMVIFGAIDFSAALAPLAKSLGYEVTIVDPRSAFLQVATLLGGSQDHRRVAGGGTAGSRSGPTERRARVLARPEDRPRCAQHRADHRRRLYRCTRQPACDGGSPRPHARRRHGRGATRPDLRALRASTSAPPRRRETALAILAEIVAHRAGPQRTVAG